ncbi:MAG: hypothetical protein RI554_10670 [Trueperaceae bacterium]|nr:hypothetical protein [Trueperaceae bacterium]
MLARITWQGWFLLVALTTGVFWLVDAERTHDAEVREATARPACEVAERYWRWRADFEASLPPGTTYLDGDALDVFLERSRFTRDVIDAHATPDHAALAPLARMVAIDADRDAEEVAPSGASLRAFATACPEAARALATGGANGGDR